MPKFIHVSGMSGVGKTTLVRSVLGEDKFANLRYLMTFTDRPPREEERNGSHEYCFVNKGQFDEVRELVMGEGRGEDWYEVRTHSGRKGVDVGYHRELFCEGKSLILNSYPSPEAIALVKERFPEVEHKLVFIEADPELVEGRLSGGSEHERMRAATNFELSSELIRVREMSDVRLECTGNLETDRERFSEIIRELLEEE